MIAGQRNGAWPDPKDTAQRQLMDTSQRSEPFKVLLYIIRRTFGFTKDADTISFKQTQVRSPTGEAGSSRRWDHNAVESRWASSIP